MKGGRTLQITRSSSISSKGPADESLRLLQQDITLLTQKLAELQGQPQVTSSIKECTILPVIVPPDKLALYEAVLSKIIEVDRVVLRQTEPTESMVSQKRRGSRGMDLTLLPTHLHVVDRLLDLNTKQNRVTVLKTTVVSEAATANLSVLGSGRKVSDSSETELIAKLRADLASERELITNLRSELSSGTDLIAKLKKDLTSKDSQLESLRNRIEELRMLNENISATVTNPSPPSKTALDELNILREELAKLLGPEPASPSPPP